MSATVHLSRFRAYLLRREMRGRYNSSIAYSMEPETLGLPAHWWAINFALREWRRKDDRSMAGSAARLAVLCAEAQPFDRMDQSVAVEALAELAVYQKIPRFANTVWLKEQIVRVLQPPFERPSIFAIRQQLQEQVSWWSLVAESVEAPLVAS